MQSVWLRSPEPYNPEPGNDTLIVLCPVGHGDILRSRKGCNESQTSQSIPVASAAAGTFSAVWLAATAWAAVGKASEAGADGCAAK